MGLRIQLGVPVLVAILAAGCNAILDTQAATSTLDAGRPAGPSSSRDGSTVPVVGFGVWPNGADAGALGDVQLPCSPCSNEQVVIAKYEPQQVRVAGDYVYWLDDTGLLRVPRGAPLCKNDDCRETVVKNSNATGSFGINSTSVCWLIDTFGCASLSDITQKEQTTTSTSLKPTTMVLVDATVYAIKYADNGATNGGTLVQVDAAGFAAGTSGLANLSASNLSVQAFGADTSGVAWIGNDSEVTRLFAKPQGGAANEIELPTTLTAETDFEMRVFQGFLYLVSSSEDYIYRAPLDGSAAATRFLGVPRMTRGFYVGPSGFFIGYGGGYQSEPAGIGFVPLAATPGSGRVLVDVDYPSAWIDVAADGLYYVTTDNSGNGGTSSGIWRVNFD